MNLKKIAVWFAKEYDQQPRMMNQEDWVTRNVCFSDEEAMREQHACRGTRDHYKATSPAETAIKLEQWAENAHTFR